MIEESENLDVQAADEAKEWIRKYQWFEYWPCA